MQTEFKSLAALTKAIPDEPAAVAYFTAIRWANGQSCPLCGSTELYHLVPKTEPRYVADHKCKACCKRFSIKVGTVMEGTKHHSSSMAHGDLAGEFPQEGHRQHPDGTDLAVIAKVGMVYDPHRLRHGARTRSFNGPLSGKVEVDETFVGGKAKNRHKDKRGKSGVTGGAGKAIVAGALERQGDVVVRVVGDVQADTLMGFVRENVSPAVDVVMTDKWVGYKHLGKEFPHIAMIHAAGEYVKGDAHTNSIEGYWSQLKRQIYGIHHWVSPKHLHYYIDESAWRFNRRDMAEGERVNAYIARMDGRLNMSPLFLEARFNIRKSIF